MEQQPSQFTEYDDDIEQYVLHVIKRHEGYMGGAEEAVAEIVRFIDAAGWYVIVDPRSGETKELDRAVFLRLLSEISEYNVQ